MAFLCDLLLQSIIESTIIIIITVGIATPNPSFAPVLSPEFDEAAGELGDTVGESV